MNIKAPEQDKPQYELRRRSENYVGIFDGDHCLAAICTKTSGGMLDALNLLRAVSCHDDLLTACVKCVGIIGIQDITIAKEHARAAIEKSKQTGEQ